MAGENFSAVDLNVIYFEEFPTVLFTSKEGGGTTNENSQIFPGGRGAPVNVNGPSTVEAVTVTKPHDPVADAPLYAWVRAWDAGVRRELTLVVQPVTAVGVPSGPPQRYVGCAKTTFTPPSATRGSAEVAMVSLVVQPRRLV
jgi:hypothetical protein